MFGLEDFEEGDDEDDDDRKMPAKQWWTPRERTGWEKEDFRIVVSST